MKNLQLTFARQIRGLTQTELSSKVDGLSQSNLSKYEKGLDILSEDVLQRIMDVLGFPMSFLDLEINNSVEFKHYRKKSTIKASQRDKLDRYVQMIAHTFDCLTDYIDFPEYAFKQIDIESGFTPTDVAKQVRRQFRLGVTPIKDIYKFLESNGIMVYQWDCDYQDFDAVSLITDKGNHLVIVNKNRSNDRIRYDLAHELGHSIMHQSFDFVIAPSREPEKEANEFASEFLMPELTIRNSLYGLKLKDACALKSYWNTSIASIIEKARRLGCINQNRYVFLRTEISRNGWGKVEPINVYIDSPTAISKAVNLIRNELGYSITDLSNIMHIPNDILFSLYEPKTNIVDIRNKIQAM